MIDDFANTMALDGMEDLLWSGVLLPEESVRTFTFLRDRSLDVIGLDIIAYCTIYWTSPPGLGARPDHQGWEELDQMLLEYGEPTTMRGVDAEWY